MESEQAHYWLGRAVGLLARMRYERREFSFYEDEMVEIISAVSRLHQAEGQEEAVGTWAQERQGAGAKIEKGRIDL